ncbi:hypothetical protein [Amycolatopsis sp. NPDC004625]|uniref:hypothetical protein n=1 Tax=Amycolatopsis sp. NPDC004625 TaxID=3154670 RepID=UPI0033B36D6D
MPASTVVNGAETEIATPQPEEGAASRSSLGWPHAVLLAVLVLFSFAFVILLIKLVGVDPELAVGIALVLVIGIALMVLPAHDGGGGRLMRRFGRAVLAFFAPHGGAR